MAAGPMPPHSTPLSLARLQQVLSAPDGHITEGHSYSRSGALSP
ncbi:hypothetical protein RVN83_36495 [Streptomyces sp. PU10]|nr:hypothetical protein [Streptomyces sp. PU10]MDU0258428.1 hypothetical protein [Streptomyces sp. PU10]